MLDIIKLKNGSYKPTLYGRIFRFMCKPILLMARYAPKIYRKLFMMFLKNWHNYMILIRSGGIFK